MKTALINQRKMTLYTIADLARAIGVSTGILWYRINSAGSFPGPTYRLNRRTYYTSADYDNLVAIANQPEQVQA